MLKLHAYQSAAAVNAVSYLIHNDQPSVLIQSATGSGKTVISAGLIEMLLKINPNFKFLIVVPSITLVEQFYNTLVRDMGLHASVLHNTLVKDKYGRPFSKVHKNIIITMRDTFAGVVAGTSDLKLPLLWVADFLVMDEAHKNTAASSQAARKHFACKVIGLTATPRREQNKDGEHLWAWYADRMIVAASIRELIELGYIVKPRVVRRPKGSVVVKDWIANTANDNNKRTILVTTEVTIAEKYEKAFLKAGVRAQLIEGKQTMSERQRYFKDFEEGRIDVLCSVDSLCEGFDCKPAKHLIIDRNMVSVALMHQCAGRVLRAFPGKDEGIIYDYGTNHELDSIENKVWSVYDYAPEVTNVVRGDRVSLNAFRSRTLAHQCVELNDNNMVCEHVYDASKHATCEACGAVTKIECAVSARDVVAKLTGRDVVDFNEYRALKKLVEEANAKPTQQSLDEANARYAHLGVTKPSTAMTRERALAAIDAAHFGGLNVVGGSTATARKLSEIFHNDLNLDDTIQFCPHTYKEVVDLLVA